MRTPASAVTIMFRSSSSTIRVMRSRQREMPPLSGMLPPVRPLAAPRGVTGISCSQATAMTRDTSSVVSGRTTRSGLLAGSRGMKEES